jgi:hypothetical protein
MPFLTKTPPAMTLSDVQSALTSVSELVFVLPDGTRVPPHFHVTEVGQVDKYFVDCGDHVRKMGWINFQLFTATDVDHRLSVEKFGRILSGSIRALQLNPTFSVEVEYQGRTVETYALDFADGVFYLHAKHTDCLAKDHCGIPGLANNAEAVSASDNAASDDAASAPAAALNRPWTPKATSCAPGSGCC